MPQHLRYSLRFIGIALLVPASGCGVSPQQPSVDEIQQIRALCNDPNRTVITRTASAIEEISVSPERGPRDGYGWDLFFHRWTSPEFLTGKFGGRYGGYKRVVLQKPGNETKNMRYHVAYSAWTTGAKFGNRDILGTKIEVFDTELSEKMAERTDYTVAQLYGSAQGCENSKNRDIGDFGKQGRDFIHSVLNPPPSVEIIRKQISQSDLEAARADKKIRTIALLDETPGSLQASTTWSKLPKEIRFDPVYASEGNSISLRDYAIRFMQQDRDILVPQGFGHETFLLAMKQHESKWIAVFWTRHSRSFVIRTFGWDGDLLLEEEARLPDSVTAMFFAINLDGELHIEPSQLRIRLSINPIQYGYRYERDIELGISR